MKTTIHNSLSSSLQACREEISSIDVQLLALLAKRRQMSLKIAKAKQAENLPLRDESREEMLLSALTVKAQEKQLDANFVALIFRTIIKDSLRIQHQYLQGSNKRQNSTEAESKKIVSISAAAGHRLTSLAGERRRTIISVKGVTIGNGEFVVIAGPCAVESRSQIMDCARQTKECGAQILRGGCFKPRTSPYSFQGLGYQGLDYLQEAGETFALPVITEVLGLEDLPAIAKQADILQIGARNMQNFPLLTAVGKTSHAVMLKRGMMSSIDELLHAAEYILAQGNQSVFLCERGIRTFETATRSTLDLSAVPVLKALTHLPIFVDPSHAVGRRDLVEAMAKAAESAGADGIMIEMHPDPDKALSDGPQSLNFEQFQKLMEELYIQTSSRCIGDVTVPGLSVYVC